MDGIIVSGLTHRATGRGYLSADHISTATGLDPAFTISKNGGNFANPAAGASVMTEIEATGWYYFALAAGDTDTVGPLICRGTHATMDDIEVVFQVVSATRGLVGTALPAVAGGGAGGIVLGSAANNLAVDAAGKVAVPDTQKVDVETIKTRAVTCAAGVTVTAYVGTAAQDTAQTGDSYAIVNGDHGLVSIQDDIDAVLADTGELQTDWVNGGRLDLILDIIAADTTTDIPTVLTAMKGATFDTATDSLEALRNRGDAAWVTATGFATPTNITAASGVALSSTGADLILKSSTFVQAIVAALNEFATYGLTALNTLLVTTGIKAASVPAVTVTTNNDKTGYALSATGGDAIAKTSTFALAIADAIWEETVRTLSANTNLGNLEVDLTKIRGVAVAGTAAQISASFSKLFDVVTPVLTCESVNQAQDNATTAEIKTALEAVGSHLTLIKAVTDALTTAAATLLATSAGTIVSAAAAAGTLSTTQMTTTLTEATDDHYNGRIIIWTSGVLQNQATDVTDYDGATKKLVYTAVTEAPTAADTFMLV